MTVLPRSSERAYFYDECFANDMTIALAYQIEKLFLLDYASLFTSRRAILLFSVEKSLFR
jgi:hypothetical protein